MQGYFRVDANKPSGQQKGFFLRKTEKLNEALGWGVGVEKGVFVWRGGGLKGSFPLGPSPRYRSETQKLIFPFLGLLKHTSKFHLYGINIELCYPQEMHFELNVKSCENLSDQGLC